MTQFEGADTYKGSEEGTISFRDIALKHYQRITQLSCVEFRGGYYEDKTRTAGKIAYTERIYIPDSRDVYVNAINSLYDILLPHFDKIMKERAEEIEELWNTRSIDLKGTKRWDVERIEIKRRLFQQLSLLLSRLGYLEGKSFGVGA